ncbi:MAG: hypothetical protein KDA91_18860 [Planctomycetaceae bacterium]|nr:hypothetical protein [Planctomycetaceae bacterium]
MKCRRFDLLLVVFTVTTFAAVAELRAQNPTPGSIARRQFNQVFVKVIMPVTARTPMQDGPNVEGWVSDQLETIGVSEYFAVTNWVPVCDGLLSDDEVNNRVWDGRLVAKNSSLFCPVEGDLPERKDGRVSVLVGGWYPVSGYEAKVSMLDEPGTRAVQPVLPYSAPGLSETNPVEKPLAYVAVLVGPPPAERVALQSNDK